MFKRWISSIVVTSLLATGVSGEIRRLRKPDGKIIPVANSVDHARYPQDSRNSNLRKLADDIQRQAARELKQMSVSSRDSSTSSCDGEDYEVRCIAVRLSGKQRRDSDCTNAIDVLADKLDGLGDKDKEKLDDYDEYDKDCDDGEDMLEEIQDRRYRRDLIDVDTHLRELKKGGKKKKKKKKKNKKSSSDCSSKEDTDVRILLFVTDIDDDKCTRDIEKLCDNMNDEKRNWSEDDIEDLGDVELIYTSGSNGGSRSRDLDHSCDYDEIRDYIRKELI